MTFGVLRRWGRIEMLDGELADRPLQANRHFVASKIARLETHLQLPEYWNTRGAKAKASVRA